ncbi:MAG TPA: LysM peptidoglycan-binding domain-containing C40 family peptidase [Syntrophorhabdaceae bacterium]|nr:LysM peptidoglycan-binding domain-containing C40 family peptidase [Syntrophorhabdaceae bacterium]
MKKNILITIISFFLFLIWTCDAFSQQTTNNKNTTKQVSNNQTKKTIKAASTKNKKTVLAKKNLKNKKKKNISLEEPVLETDGEFIEYRTKKGDTLDGIAKRFNIDKEELLEANNLKDGVKLNKNMVILIPKTLSEEKMEEFVELTNKNLKPWKSNDEKYLLVKVAKSFIGAPYKYGGNSVRGLDCSAYVKKIYEIFDVQLPRSAREQFHVGTKISKEELAIGDLVFFRTKRYIKYPTHVGIYIGDGYFIHSSSGNGRIGVKIDSLSSDFYSRTYVGATRVKKPYIEENADVKRNTTPDDEVSKS